VSAELFSRACHVDRSLENPFNRAEGIGQPADFRGRSADGDDLQTMVVVEMNVLGGNDQIVGIVLDIGEAVDEVFLMMIVNEGDSAGDLAARTPLLLDERAADEVAEGFGPAGRAAFGDEGVKPVEEILPERYSEADELIHQRRCDSEKKIP